MSINRLVSGAILLIAGFVALLGGYVALSKMIALQELSIASVRLQTIRVLGDIPRSFNNERGLTTVDLLTMAPGDQAKLSALGDARTPTDAALAAAEAQIAAVQGRLDDAAPLASEMAELTAVFKDYRRLTTERLQMPIGERGDVVAVTKQQGIDFNDRLSLMMREELRRLASAGSEAFRDANLADLAWALRDAGGRQAGALQTLLIARKPVQAEQRVEIFILEGRVQQAWSWLSPLLNLQATPDSIKTPLNAVKSLYIDGLGADKRAIESAFDTGDFPMDTPTWRARIAPVWPAIMALRDAFYDLAAKDIGDARTLALWHAILATLVLIVALAVAAGLLVMVRRRVTTPITAMTRAMGRIANGELATEVPGSGRADEIGEMAKAVLVFRDTALDKLDRDRQLEVERSRSEDERRATEAQTIERERALVTHSIGAGLAKLAAKDLAYRMTDELPQAYRRLQADFNTAMQQLEEAMIGIAGTVQTIEEGSQQITSAADDLAKRTEQQAASLEETAAALEEVTVTVDKTADGARQANAMVGTARVDAENSGQVVRQAIVAMGGIEKSSKQIGQIIGVIDEIAFQTNLLALNAGVEAARAGDAGKGFAVVASEVRALAQRTAEAAKEIKSLISASTRQVNEGVDLVADSGKALERIVAQVKEVSHIVAEIAAGATQQATALKEVNTAVNQMDQVTQRNAAMVQETTVASHTLFHEASDLFGAVSRFKVTSSSLESAAAKPARRSSTSRHAA